MQIQLEIKFKISIPYERKKGNHHLSALLLGVLGMLNAQDVTEAAVFFRALNLLCQTLNPRAWPSPLGTIW